MHPDGVALHPIVRDAIDAEPLEPVSVKGKAEPLHVFLVRGIRHRVDPGAGPGAPFVGRDADGKFIGTLKGPNDTLPFPLPEAPVAPPAKKDEPKKDEKAKQ